MSFNIIVKEYQHWNRSFPNWDSPKGKYIRSKKHYEETMRKYGYVPYEKAEQVTQPQEEKHKLSDKAYKFLYQVKDMSDKKGNIKPGSRFVDGLREVGVKVDLDMDKLPKHYRIDQGGFE